MTRRAISKWRPYYAMTEHSMAPEMLLMSKKVYDTLTPQEQQMWRDAAKASVPVHAQAVGREGARSRARWSRRAARRVTEVDKKSFQDAMKPVYDKFITDPKMKDMVSKIQASN